MDLSVLLLRLLRLPLGLGRLLHLLLGLLDGTQDGDALFFNRVISISGRTEAVLALRNAIEDAELSPSDLLGLRGPLAALADAGILGGMMAARQLAVSAQMGPKIRP